MRTRADGVDPLVGKGLLAGLLAAGMLVAGPTGAVAAMSDVEIANEVEEEFLFDQAIDLNEIDIDVEAGIVELEGSVDSFWARYRAETLASTVKGVLAVDNDLVVTPTLTRTDREIHRDVKDALLYDPATDSYEIDVEVDDGVVTLSGTVESWHEKTLSESVASGVRGVRAVIDRIDIQYDVERVDSEIEAEIEQKLAYDTLVDSGPLTVEVENGEVTLTGTATTLAEKNQAIIDAWTNGVTDVDASGVAVVWEPEVAVVAFVPPSEDAIEGAIHDAMVVDPRVSSFEVTADVKDGVATLRGVVDNLKARRAAVQVARTTTGVERVKDRIKVRPSAMPADPALEKDVTDALLRAPMVESYEVDVTVRNGSVILDGTVDSFAEAAAAEDVAAGVYGVTRIHNELDVVGDTVAFTYEPYAYPYYPYVETWTYYVPESSPLTDAEIRDDIESELWWSPWVDADQVKVEVDDSVATLTGEVDSFREYSAAEENAIEGGAVWVKNRLLIDTSGSTE